jgi:hypothetical protein
VRQAAEYRALREMMGREIGVTDYCQSLKMGVIKMSFGRQKGKSYLIREGVIRHEEELSTLS